MRDVIAAQPDQTVSSFRQLFALMRLAKIQFSDSKAKDALALLVADGSVIESSNGRSNGYSLASTASEGTEL